MDREGAMTLPEPRRNPPGIEAQRPRVRVLAGRYSPAV